MKPSIENRKSAIANAAALREISPPDLALAAAQSHVTAEETYELLKPFGEEVDVKIRNAGILLIRLHSVLVGIDQAIEVAPTIERLRECHARALVKEAKGMIGAWLNVETIAREIREDAEMR